MCINEENCGTLTDGNYAKLVYESDFPEVKKAINKINDDTEKYYQESLSSTMDDPSCLAVKDIYKHSIQVFNDFSVKLKNDILGISVNRSKKNLCTQQRESMQVESYLFDTKSKKMLTQEEFKKKMHLDNKKIENAIKENIKTLNQYSDINYSLENVRHDNKNDIILYYNLSGELLVSYFQSEDQTYYSAVVLKA